MNLRGLQEPDIYVVFKVGMAYQQRKTHGIAASCTYFIGFEKYVMSMSVQNTATPSLTTSAAHTIFCTRDIQ